MDYRLAARHVAENAYCPYSKFRVGAIACVTDGKKRYSFKGVNVENASYGLTICAERVAIFNAISTLGSKFKLVAVAICCLDADYVNMNMNTIMPCGACRQVISEFGDDETIILIEGISKTFSIEELLKMPFRINKN